MLHSASLRRLLASLIEIYRCRQRELMALDDGKDVIVVWRAGIDEAGKELREAVDSRSGDRRAALILGTGIVQFQFYMRQVVQVVLNIHGDSLQPTERHLLEGSSAHGFFSTSAPHQPRHLPPSAVWGC